MISTGFSVVLEQSGHCQFHVAMVPPEEKARQADLVTLRKVRQRPAGGLLGRSWLMAPFLRETLMLGSEDWGRWNSRRQRASLCRPAPPCKEEAQLEGVKCEEKAGARGICPMPPFSVSGLLPGGGVTRIS